MKNNRLSACVVALAAVAAPARAQWSSTQLSQPRAGLAATTVGDLAFFAGGWTGSTCGGPGPGPYGPSDVVDIYNAAAGHPTDPGAWSTARLSVARGGLAATSVGGFALFAGGAGDEDVVEAYDASTGTWSVTQLVAARGPMSATALGDLALFGDGSVVELYDSALGVPSDPGAWWWEAVPAGGVATSVGDYAFFVDSGVIHIFEGATRTWLSHPALAVGRATAATTVGTKALFAFSECPIGGDRMSVLIYDGSLGGPTDPFAWSLLDLGPSRAGVAAAAVGGRAVFMSVYPCCLCSDGGASELPADVYISASDQWLVSSQPSLLPGSAGTSVDGMALFAGGIACFMECCSTIGEVLVYEQHNFCAANSNSTGLAAAMTVDGTASIQENELTLRAEPVPSQPFLFFYGPQQQEVPFGNGYLCAGGGLTRIAPPGTAQDLVAQSQVDLPSAGISAPGTLYFQCWYRDPSAGAAMFSTSDGIRVTIVP